MNTKADENVGAPREVTRVQKDLGRKKGFVTARSMVHSGADAERPDVAMSNSKHKPGRRTGPRQDASRGSRTSPGWGKVLWMLGAGLLVAGLAVAAKLRSERPPEAKAAAPQPQGVPTPKVAPTTPAPDRDPKPATPPTVTTNVAVGATMPVNQAVMVTVELDFGPRVPGVAEALTQIERRSQPADGRGRTFAILDAYGGPTPDGKQLHLSMHVSAEKPGLATLIFRPTGRELWKTQILAATNAQTFTGKDLSIMLDDGAGKSYLVDGSQNPPTLMEALLRGAPTTVGEFWPEGAEREVTFLYSACGCPVKVKARRLGQQTVRTQEMPVIFPDDPAVVGVISRLMGWR